MDVGASINYEISGINISDRFRHLLITHSQRKERYNLHSL